MGKSSKRASVAVTAAATESTGATVDSVDSASLTRAVAVGDEMLTLVQISERLRGLHGATAVVLAERASLAGAVLTGWSEDEVFVSQYTNFDGWADTLGYSGSKLRQEVHLLNDDVLWPLVKAGKLSATAALDARGAMVKLRAQYGKAVKDGLTTEEQATAGLKAFGSRLAGKPVSKARAISRDVRKHGREAVSLKPAAVVKALEDAAREAEMTPAGQLAAAQAALADAESEVKRLTEKLKVARSLRDDCEKRLARVTEMVNRGGKLAADAGLADGVPVTERISDVERGVALAWESVRATAQARELAVVFGLYPAQVVATGKQFGDSRQILKSDVELAAAGRVALRKQ